VLWDVAFSRDGKLIASGGGHEDHTVRLWQAASKKSPPRLKGNKGRVRNLVIASGGQYYATSSTGSGFGGESNDNSIRLWSVASGVQEVVFRDGHEWWIECMQLLDSGMLISGSHHPTIRFWDISSRRTVFTLERDGATAHALAVSADGKVVAAVLANDNVLARRLPSIALWDLGSRMLLNTIRLEAGSHVNAIAFAPDGKRLFGALGEDAGINGVYRDSTRKCVCVWDTRNGTCLRELDDHKDSVSALAASATGMQVVSGSWDGAVIIRDGETLRPRQVLDEFADRVEYLAYSRCGTLLYTGTKYDLVSWHTSDWQAVYSVKVSSAGTRWTIGRNEVLWFPSPLEHPKNIGDGGDRFVGTRGYHAMCVNLTGAAGC